jgi:hypothetical protein
MNRQAMMAHCLANKSINITDFDKENDLWVYDELDDISKNVLIQCGIDLLVEIKLGLALEEDDGDDNEQQTTHPEATEGDEG